MAVKAGEPADATDVWLRVITENKYWKPNGTLHNSAFGGKAISPPDATKSWTLELSGRLLSLAKDAEKEGREFCRPPREFAGLMFQTVENLRSDGNGLLKGANCKTDVIFSPNNDPAHADIVAYGPTAENKFVIRDWLQDMIQFFKADNCSVIEALRK
jgi:hypothetical protein